MRHVCRNGGKWFMRRLGNQKFCSGLVKKTHGPAFNQIGRNGPIAFHWHNGFGDGRSKECCCTWFWTKR